MIHLYMGKYYREVEADSCEHCDLKPPGLNEICYVHIWANKRSHTKVVCGIRPVIFKEIEEDE